MKPPLTNDLCTGPYKPNPPKWAMDRAAALAQDIDSNAYGNTRYNFAWGVTEAAQEELHRIYLQNGWRGS